MLEGWMGQFSFVKITRASPPFSQDAVHSVLCLRDIQFLHCALFQPAQDQSALSDAPEICHRHPARGHHPAHLVIFAFLHPDEAFAGVLRLQLCREAQRPVSERQPCGKQRTVLCPGRAFVLCVVRLPDAAARA